MPRELKGAMCWPAVGGVGVGLIYPLHFKMLIPLEPKVRLTSEQPVNLSLSVVLRSITKIHQFGPSNDPGGPFLCVEME